MTKYCNSPLSDSGVDVVPAIESRLWELPDGSSQCGLNARHKRPAAAQDTDPGRRGIRCSDVETGGPRLQRVAVEYQDHWPNWLESTLRALASRLSLSGAFAPVLAEENGRGSINETQILMDAKISIADAIRAAELEARGKAVGSGLNDKDGDVS